MAQETREQKKAPQQRGIESQQYIDDEWGRKIGLLSPQIAAEPNNVALLLARGEALLRARLFDGSHDTPNAFLDFQKAAEINPKDPAAWVGMARAITRSELPQNGAEAANFEAKKRAYLQKALDLNPQFAPSLVEMGWMEWEGATGGVAPLSRLASIVKPSPENTAQLKKAGILAEEALQIDAQSGRAWLLKAEVLADSNRARDALEAYKTSLALDAVPAREALKARVDAFDATEASADALLYLAVLEPLEQPVPPDFYALRARAKFRLQDWEGAAADTDKAVESAGRGARRAAMLVLRGQLKLQQNDPVGAKTDFEAAYAADPKNLDALDVLRQIYAAQGNFTASIRVSNQLLEQRSDAHQVRFLLAMLLAFTGDMEGSKAAYEASVSQVSRRDVENQLQDVTKNLKKAPTFEPLLQAQRILQQELTKRG
ncbi:MAG: tetratricopeptide repeat protein [Armatimonadetes bacterium]|nr:tetratricopeptide repeat protein [Armatimonadota bacterium]